MIEKIYNFSKHRIQAFIRVKKMNRAFQKVIQLFFLILFFALILIGRIQLWMGLFIIGIVSALWLSRIYCGWVCPINTAISFVVWVKNKMHLRTSKTPSFLVNPLVRFIVLAAFIVAFFLSNKFGLKLPVLPVVFILGIVSTIFYAPEVWHHNLCPFGTILSLPARLAGHSVQVSPDKCVNCGICYQVCPAKSVKRLSESHQIIKNECLVCTECARKCPKDAITYQ